MDFVFFTNSILLGVGLAMDAFSVSMANGLAEPKMKPVRMSLIAGVYGVFQALMPLIGWLAVHTAAEHFKTFQKFIPYIALVLLCYIGGKMIYEGVKNGGEEESVKKLTFAVLMVQGVATSIDALSVGFTIADYDFLRAFVCAVIIATVTFVICVIGLIIGKKFGTVLANKASIAGGAILVFIGLEIFIKGII